MINRRDSSQYALLKSEEAGSTFGDDDPGVDATMPRALAEPDFIPRIARLAYKLILVASLIANLAFVVALYSVKALPANPQGLSQQVLQQACRSCSESVIQQPELEKTLYAELEYNTNGTWESETPYAQENVTAADEEWMAIDITNAFVALEKGHAKQLGLPPSLPFPWDVHKKDLYLISSIHSVHCLTVLHRSNLEYRRSHTQTYSTEHVLHCLDNLRVDIQCSADDTPRFIPPQATESTVKTGVGQIRQCRDWSKLNSWAKEHGACFNYNKFLSQELNNNKVYPLAWQFCEKGNEYLPIVQKFLGKGPDWVAPLPGWPDIDEIQH